jgi:hypothetical protein
MGDIFFKEQSCGEIVKFGAKQKIIKIHQSKK